MNSKYKKAQKRAEEIISVLSGQKTPTQAHHDLGISRQVYYEWQKKAVDGMMEALTDKKAGRPKKPVDLEKDALKTENLRLQKEMELMKAKMRYMEVMTHLDGSEENAERSGRSATPFLSKKKKRKGQRNKRKRT